MAEDDRVILHGFWCSTYVKRVELALKIKGIPFKYVEEDLTNKSDLLLRHNPIHKKVPVLVHYGKPIVESLNILEYIDETWGNKPWLLPEDPYERARVRFWAGYIQQVLESIGKLFTSVGKLEAKEKTYQEMLEKLDVLEEGARSFLSGDNPRVVGEDLDLLDILVVATFGAFRAQEEVLEVKIVDREKHPFIFRWVTNLMESPVVQEVVVPHDDLVSFLQVFKQNATKF